LRPFPCRPESGRRQCRIPRDFAVKKSGKEINVNHRSVATGSFATVAEPAEALRESEQSYNEGCLIERPGDRPPSRVRID
jgi:hypothetical protein